jgi:hypothetical protein
LTSTDTIGSEAYYPRSQWEAAMLGPEEAVEVAAPHTPEFRRP